MRSRYVTALLVVLAATGIEAQVFRSVLEQVLSEVAIIDINSQLEKGDLKIDILSVIGSIKTQSCQEQQKLSCYRLNIQRFTSTDTSANEFTDQTSTSWNNPAIGSSVSIRAPSFC